MNSYQDFLNVVSSIEVTGENNDGVKYSGKKKTVEDGSINFYIHNANNLTDMEKENKEITLFRGPSNIIGNLHVNDSNAVVSIHDLFENNSDSFWSYEYDVEEIKDLPKNVLSYLYRYPEKFKKLCNASVLDVTPGEYSYDRSGSLFAIVTQFFLLCSNKKKCLYCI